MLKNYVFLFFVIFISSFCFGQETSSIYDQLWSKVENFEQKGQPKSALEIVEGISKRAKRNDDPSQILKGLLFKSRYLLIFEEDAQLKIVQDFKTHIVQAEFPTKNMLENILANLYWQYFQENRYQFYRRTETGAKVDSVDFRTWDLKTLFKEIDRHFQYSIQNAELLQETDLENFKEILLEEESDDKKRLSLYDFLAHNALTFYKSSETRITAPADKFLLSDPQYLADAKVFSQLPLTVIDSSSTSTKTGFSMELEALKIYQNLIHFHLENNNFFALAICDIARLEFVKSHASFTNSEEILLKALSAGRKRQRIHPTSALYAYKIAEEYVKQGNRFDPENSQETDRWKLKKALELCRTTIAKFPQSKGAQKCRSLKQGILRKELRILAEKYLPVQKPSRLLVHYTNLDSLVFQISRLDEKQVNTFLKLRNTEDRAAFAKKLKSLKTWSISLPNELDYQPHTTEILFPKMNNGRYLIFAKSGEGKIVATRLVQVTDVALIEKNMLEKLVFQIVDRNNGRPIAGAKAEISYTKNTYENGRKEENRVEIQESDQYGNFVLNKPKNGNYRNIQIQISNSKEIAFFKGYYANNYYRYDRNEEPTYKSFLFTDRSIYRPGQTVYFKGIVFERNDGKTKVLANTNVSVTVEDANYQELKTLQLKTNEFGSVQGEFILPYNGLNGTFQLKIFSNKFDFYEETYISVEEYKRPTFKVDFEPVTQTFQVNDSVFVTGEALAFSGSKITDAKVVYNVHRRVNFPFLPWGRRPIYQGGKQEIAHGELKTNKNGKFEIVFKAIPDENIPQKSLPVFQYQITADITDINGETHRETTLVKVGYHTLNATISVAPKLNKEDKTHKILLGTTNLNGEFVPTEGELSIYKLQAPEFVLRPRPWQVPDYQQFTKKEFKRLFPHESYSNLTDPSHQEKGELVFETNFDTGKDKEVPLGRIRKWEAGQYLVELKTTDRYGQKVEAQSKTVLYSPKDKQVSDKQLFTIKADKNQYKVGEEVKVIIGSAAKDLTVSLLIEKDHQIIDKRMVQLKNQKETIFIPISQKDVGGFSVHYSFAAFNYFQSGTLDISVLAPSTKLEIETMVFRDHLQVGQEETWSFQINGPKGKAVSAELLASMYDTSLDQFKSHSWFFEPIEKNRYYSRFDFRARASFGTGWFSVQHPSLEKIAFPVVERLKMNWFGLSFQDPHQRRWRYLVNKYGNANPATKMYYKSSIEKGYVEGTVQDGLSGMPLAGINIGVKGTSRGGQTDFDGNFRIQVADKNAVLVFTYIGYKEVEMPIGENNYFEVALFVSDAALEEVVVTAYGTLTSAAVTTIVESRVPGIELAGNGNLSGSDDAVITTNSLEPTEVHIRKNLKETAFFFPEMRTDENGKVSFSFTSPEALTKWKLQLLAHTKNGQSTTKTLYAVTQKELMLTPNVPRFLREEDQIVISAKIANLTKKNLSGRAVLQLYNAINNEEITEKLLMEKDNKSMDFSIPQNGNTTVSWKLHIPTGVPAVKYKFVAKAENFSDGVQAVLPVLSNRTLVTETIPMWVRAGETKTFTLEKLKDTTSKTLEHHQLTLEITSNPAWYAIKSLPYLMEYPYQCNEQTFARYYANALAGHILNSNPRVKEVFQQWKNSGALLSNLEKNQELKSLLIEETPWLRDAQSQTERQKRLALLFDLNNLSEKWRSANRKLQQNQLSNGSWAWFPGGRSNRFITQHIVAGFGHLLKLGVGLPKEKTQDMLEKSLYYLDAEFEKTYKDIAEGNSTTDLTKNHLSHIQLHYLYLRSFFPNIEKSEEVARATTYYLGQIQEYWLTRSLYDKGLMAMIMYKNGEVATANNILKSLKETSVFSEEMGMYWKSNKPSWFWFQAPIETQSLLIEAFSEIANDTKTVNNLKIWLLKNKQTSHWQTTKATTNAVYALLMQGSDWLSVSEAVDVKIGEETLPPSVLNSAEAGTGYLKTNWEADEITSKMATVEISKKGTGVAWGGLYWQYFEDLDKITHSETPLQLTKKLFLVKNMDVGEKLFNIGGETMLDVGDLIRVRIELKVDRSMEFVHMKDMRASGLEPVNVLSKYKWQDGLGYYEVTKDASTNFFFDRLPKGVYVFEYDLRVNNAGDFSNGITTIQCMYAPEFTSHSKGVRVSIDNGE